MALPSWLSKFGSVMKSIFVAIPKVEAVAKPIIETLLPASIPIFNVFDELVVIAADVERSFAMAGQQTAGVAKLAASLPGLEAALNAYTLAKFPGSASILKSEAYLAAQAPLMNAIVGYLNAIPESLLVIPTAVVPPKV